MWGFFDHKSVENSLIFPPIMHVVTFSTSAYSRMQIFVWEQFDSICAETRVRALSFFRQLRLSQGDAEYFRCFAASIVSRNWFVIRVKFLISTLLARTFLRFWMRSLFACEMCHLRSRCQHISGGHYPKRSAFGIIRGTENLYRTSVCCDVPGTAVQLSTGSLVYWCRR